MNNFKRFLDEKRPRLTKLSQVTPGVIEEYRRFRLSEKTGNGNRPVKKRTLNLEVSALKTFLNRAVEWDIFKITGRSL